MKSTQCNQLVLIGVTIFVLFGLSLRQPRTAYSQFESPLPTPSVTPTKGVIDLSVDKNLDGVPDQLLTAIEELEAVIAQVNELGDISDNPTAQAMLQQAQEDFDRQMPYSAKTRADQTRMVELNQALFAATDQATREKLWRENEALQRQMLLEPEFALVAQIINRRLSDAINAKIADDIAASEKTAIPMPTATPVATAVPTTAILPESAVIEAAAINAPTAANGGIMTSQPVVWIRTFLREGCTTTSAPNFTLLTRGELMFYAGDNKTNNFFFAMKYSHVGLYDGITSGAQFVYEANPGDGVNIRPLLGNWNTSQSCVAFARVNGTTAAQRQSTLDWAKSTYGTNGATPYNYNFLDKNTNTALYCSQLPWKTFMHINIDLDSNSVTYSTWLSQRYTATGSNLAATTAANLMVTPDEIALDSDVAIYHHGWTN